MTFTEARDEIFTIFKTYWTTTSYTVVWPDVPGSVPASETPWARVELKHFLGFQASLADENGRKKFDRSGTFFVQIFTPIGQGLEESYVLGQGTVDVFQDAKISGLFFRDIRINEIGNDGSFYQINVLIDFTYED